ncbi:hypothetical protein [Crateriforma conspicua]|uniref:Uncharacterized protein n=1 Tax=Crateriforma conspicua TaxID=2527996 RepID=A0A5C5YA51_9PLAN|nr:hypothetical protein [Crateriforma conspicua]QDV64795.1 hypothetical protein Mal65_39590 [Crateriforma conspicua]TWT70192.1 hypothetical protein Pan14r_24930 [Crateriforma conspicua]
MKSILILDPRRWALAATAGLVVASAGCQTASFPRMPWSMTAQKDVAEVAPQCEGGACEIPGDGKDVMLTGGEDTPASLFAKLNQADYVEKHREQAEQAERVAKIPDGPDSLFAPYR